MRLDLGLSASGGAELARTLQALPNAVRRRAMLKLLRDAAWPIAGRAAELAPIDPTTKFHLKDWILISPLPEGTADAEAAVAIGPSAKAFWGYFIEFGTVKMSAHPFMRPAFDYGTERTLEILRAGTWDLLSEAIASSSSRGTSSGEGLL